jgi:hypothetical protein
VCVCVCVCVLGGKGEVFLFCYGGHRQMHSNNEN